MRRVLCVDDEARILEGLERQFRRQFEMRTALGPELALQAIKEEGPFGVVVTDVRMPGMNGIEFLARVREIAPDTVRVVLTGVADFGAAIAAVNDGKVFQFLNKPCPAEALARTLESALAQYDLVTAERELLERTLRGSIAVMSEILSLVNPTAFSRANRVARYVAQMARKLELSHTWQFELAAMLSQIGCVTVPPDLLDKYYRRQPLNVNEQKVLSAQTQIGHDLLVQIPRLADVAQMVQRQEIPAPENAGCAEPVRTGANLLKVALDFDEQLTAGKSADLIIAQMKGSKDYNPACITALQELQREEGMTETSFVRLSDLKPRMVISRSVYSKSGMLLLGKGQQVTESAIARLKSFASLHGIVEPIGVILPQADEPFLRLPSARWPKD